MKAKISLSIDPFLWSKFEAVVKRMGWDSKSLVVENALKQIVEQYDLKAISQIDCKCGAKFFNTIKSFPDCPMCGADCSTQLFSNKDRSVEAAQLARDQKSAVQRLD